MSRASLARVSRSPKANEFVRFSQDIQAAVAVLEFCNCYDNDVAKLWLWYRLLRRQPRPPMNETWFSSGYMAATRFHHHPAVDIEQRYAQACAKFDAIRMHGAPRLQRLGKLAFSNVETPLVIAVPADAPGREVANGHNLPRAVDLPNPEGGQRVLEDVQQPMTVPQVVTPSPDQAGGEIRTAAVADAAPLTSPPPYSPYNPYNVTECASVLSTWLPPPNSQGLKRSRGLGREGRME